MSSKVVSLADIKRSKKKAEIIAQYAAYYGVSKRNKNVNKTKWSRG